MATRTRPLPLLVVLLGSLPGCAKLYDVNVGYAGADYWIADFAGDVTVGDGFLNGTVIDVDDTLDLDDEDIVNLYAAGQIGPVTIEASYFDADYSGDSVLSQTITFRGTEFTFDTPISSDVEILAIGGEVKIGLVGVGPLAVGVIVGGQYLDLEAELDSLATGTVSDELEFGLPTVGVIATVDQPITDYLSLFAHAEISGMGIDAFDIRGGFYDAAGRVGFSVSFFRLGAGYRYVAVDVEETDVNREWDLSLGGPFVFAEFVF